MKIKVRGLNQMVLEKRERERNKRFSRIYSIVMGLMVLCFLALSAVLQYRTFKIRKAESLPTWADFKVSGVTYSLQLGFDTETSLPTSLLINGERWSVVKVAEYEPGSTSTAETNCAARTITYIRAQKRGDLKESIMHEIFHAGACVHGGDTWWNSINPDNHHHVGVYHLGQFMAEFAPANPEMMEWLARNN